jgi:cold shock CspA family protein/ribosome-associated translation inhibitor RaiA
MGVVACTREVSMELQLQITARNIPLSEDLDRALRKEAAKLEAFYPRIIGCRVLIEAPHRFSDGKARSYTVRIDLTVPKGELPTTRQSHDEVWTAAQRAFDAAQRQLEDYARVQRGDTGTAHDGARGRILRLFPYEGYGFLETPDHREVYFHRNSVLNRGFDRLEVGDEVRFVEEPGEKGPQASTVATLTRNRRASPNR